jgi:O-antigen ligase
MPSAIASAIFCLGILGLFALDRDRTVKTSRALWFALAWCFLNASRSPSDWLSVFGLAVASTPRDAQEIYIEGSPTDRLIYAALLAVGLLILISRSRRVAQLLRDNRPILIFFLYCAISVFWSSYPSVAFKRWIKALGDIVMVMVVLTDLRPARALQWVMLRTGFLAVPLSVLFIKYYGYLGRSYNRWSAEQMYNGVTTGKNLLGMTCLIYGLAILWRLIGVYRAEKSKLRSRRLLAYGVVLAMALWLLWKSNSMTSLSCFLLAGALLLVANRRLFVRKPALLHLFVVVVVGAAFSVLFWGVAGGVLETMGRNPTLTGRTTIWSTLARFVQYPLIGAGFESFWVGGRLLKLWSALDQQLNEAHNGYLEIYLNLGWLGATLLAIVIVSGYRKAVAAYRRDMDMGSMALVYCVVAIIYSFTEAGFRMLSPVWFAFLLGIMSASHRPSPQTVGTEDTFPVLSGESPADDQVR